MRHYHLIHQAVEFSRREKA